MIRPVTHAPFAAGDCAACHPPAPAAPGKAAAGAAPGTPARPAPGASPGRVRAAECAACHEPFGAGHPTSNEVPCLACHAPHATSAPSLIAGRERELCLACHETIAARRAGAVSFHPAAGGLQDCTVCHAVHAGRGPGLLRRGGADATCSACHAAHAQFSHPMGAGVPDRSHPGRSVGCLSCHDPHGTTFPQFLLADPRQDLCLRCHAEGIR
jgi:predicted CXXCH cytochrome family protein